MPTYEYHCEECHERFAVFLSYSEYDQAEVHCPKCGGDKVRRRIGRIRIAKSEESRMENLVDPSSLEGIEDDPKAMGRLMRQMQSELGEDVGPEFDEVISRLEKGQDPAQIEKEMPELADLGDGGGPDWEE
ncbi:MAG: FmdB family zinc ribbon protein [Chloroflexota bacterium]|nr:FmdB family zinc ribbon protein [Chloroflexota bacterium]